MLGGIVEIIVGRIFFFGPEKSLKSTMATQKYLLFSISSYELILIFWYGFY